MLSFAALSFQSGCQLLGGLLDIHEEVDLGGKLRWQWDCESTCLFGYVWDCMYSKATAAAYITLAFNATARKTSY